MLNQMTACAVGLVPWRRFLEEALDPRGSFQSEGLRASRIPHTRARPEGASSRPLLAGYRQNLTRVLQRLPPKLPSLKPDQQKREITHTNARLHHNFDVGNRKNCGSSNGGPGH